MAYNRYKCSVCGCNLDPGEGSMCDDCRRISTRAPILQSVLSSMPFRDVSKYISDTQARVWKVDTLLQRAYCWSPSACNRLYQKVLSFSYTLADCNSDTIERCYDMFEKHLSQNVDLEVDDVDGLYRIIQCVRESANDS